MKSRAALLMALIAAMLAPGNATAATTTATFQVRITIASACQVTSANDLDFGSQGVLGANVDAQTTLSVTCTLGTSYNVGLDAGTGAGATVAVRKMTGPAAATVNYSLYRDPARLLVWGNTVGTDTVPGVGTGLAISSLVYGRVPAQATPGPGLYTDTITVTVTF
ncbi:MAG TPA: spore coat U domain-containing protein [Xanthobacteraceae bacterium]|nr:spore coat U domain-containing protein [Xanthobacteraceae bacterium]